MGDGLVRRVEKVLLVGKAVDRPYLLQDPKMLRAWALQQHGDVASLELVDDLAQGLRPAVGSSICKAPGGAGFVFTRTSSIEASFYRGSVANAPKNSASSRR
ncbi:MAG: hypothetical protein IPN02_16425 [Candidatus Microthrix sp.]|uniref:Uncharacterized protein n=1 Tax=Candidatus Neomicrothrix subdominans TaxID=2954438 RepID=A0A936NDM2_9ACTN|nr:hypothetical protein [Candidatus Microthrix subdominans]